MQLPARNKAAQGFRGVAFRCAVAAGALRRGAAHHRQAAVDVLQRGAQGVNACGARRGQQCEKSPNANGACACHRGARACDLLVPFRELQHRLRLRVEQLPLLHQRCKLLLRGLVSQRRRRRRRLLGLLVFHLHIRRVRGATGFARSAVRRRLGSGQLLRKQMLRLL